MGQPIFFYLFQDYYISCWPHYNLLADPGEGKGCSINSLVINSLTDSVSLFFPQLYGAAAPKRFKIALQVIKYTMI